MKNYHGTTVRRYLHFPLMFTTLLSIPTGGAWANEELLASLEDFSLKDLMQIEVSSASRKSQPLSDTPAAAFIISHEDIRRSGATSIPEALRLAPGVEVAQIGSSRWAITSRGFNDVYANKLLVLMDGRTVYTSLFSGVFWDLQDTLLEDIERIEVIRGPGAAMWGANAVNGVINIITKKTKDTLGNLLVAGAGNQEQGFAAFRHGAKLDDNCNYRIYGKGFSRDAAVNTAGQKQNDDWRSGQLGFRIDHNFSSDNRLTLQGDTYRKTVGETTYPIMTVAPFNSTIQADDHASGTNLLARWEGNLSGGSDFSLQTYYDRTHFTASILTDTEHTLDVDFQHRLHPNASNDLMWGANYRHINSIIGNTNAISFTPASTNYHNTSAFVQDDISLIANRLHLTLGSKLERSHFGGRQFQPNARILWTPNRMHSVWGAVSRASRTPSRGEAQSNIALGTIAGVVQVQSIANPNLAAEKVTATEIGYRAQWSNRFSSDITAFSNRYSNLINFTPGTPGATLPMYWTNSSQTATVQGMELTADWNVLDWMRLTAAYSRLSILMPADPNNADISRLSPHQHGSLRWQMDLNAKSKFDLTLRHVGQLAATNQTVPAYTAIDARIAYAPSKGLELSLAGQNLFTPQHMEFRKSAALSPLSLPSEIPRAIYAKAIWSY